MPEPTLTWASVAPATPEIYLAVAVCVILLVEAFTGDKRRGLADSLTLIALVVGALLTAVCAHVSERTTLFHGMYVADELGYVLKLAGFLIVAVALLYSRAYLEQRDILRGEYNVLCLTALLGIFVLVSSNSLITVYMGVELLALSVYALIAFDRESGVAAEAAMKYFVLSAIASGALLYGMSIIYGMTGTLDLDVIASRVNAGHASLGVIFGLVFIIVAVAFKLGAVPFHMWLPDVYHGAPTSVTLFISTVPQLAYFSLAFRLLPHGLSGETAEWSQMLAPLSVLTHRWQCRCDCTKQLKTHARVLNHRECRLHSAWVRCRHTGRLQRRTLLHTRLYLGRTRILWRHSFGEPPRFRGGCA